MGTKVTNENLKIFDFSDLYLFIPHRPLPKKIEVMMTTLEDGESVNVLMVIKTYDKQQD
jgi:hypothetical protein